MRSAPSVALASLLAVGALAGGAGAAPGDLPAPREAVGRAAPVIGGTDVPAGQYRDVAAVLYGGEQGCSGVLIAPTVVMTAAHCLDPELDAVLLGTNSLARPSAGELIAVARQIVYPAEKYDVALLVLARASVMPVRKLATGWAQDEIVDGAAVDFVGYGAIDANAGSYVDELQQARSTITDAGCTRSAGCDGACRPDGEIGAGGAGIDTCPGDSGGPMYLRSAAGDLLVGITSRGYDDNQFECSEGGIYTRPDKDEIVAWVERETAAYLHDGWGPRGDDLTIAPGATAATVLAANDPRAGATHTWEIVTPPATGTATLAPDGTLTVQAPDTVSSEGGGEAFVVIRAVDTADPTRAARIRIALRYEDDGGCCQTGRGRPPLAMAGLAAAVGLLLARRRRGGA